MGLLVKRSSTSWSPPCSRATRRCLWLFCFLACIKTAKLMMHLNTRLRHPSTVELSYQLPDTTHEHFEPSAVSRLGAMGDLGLDMIDVQLHECRIASTSGVGTRNWTAWVKDYVPPKCEAGIWMYELGDEDLTQSARDEVTLWTQPDISYEPPRSGDKLMFSAPRSGLPASSVFSINPMRGLTGISQATADQPSVAVVFLDAVSRANFFRNFPRTKRLIQNMSNGDASNKSKAKAFTLGGLASVYKFTPPNFMASMAGILCSGT